MIVSDLCAFRKMMLIELFAQLKGLTAVAASAWLKPRSSLLLRTGSAGYMAGG